VDEVGEICVSNPGVYEGSTYTEADKNRELFADGRFLRTGDLGRIDADGYLFITGRAKDLIIRGGHNIDPAIIEEALMGHEAVAFVGAIGQPDAHAGELPCAYVELVKGAHHGRRADGLCRQAYPERAAHAQVHRDPARTAEDRGGQGVQARPAPIATSASAALAGGLAPTTTTVVVPVEPPAQRSSWGIILPILGAVLLIGLATSGGSDDEDDPLP
jgi:fatty-acyl-CoA synthase